jgi:invasion protein IalB
MRSLIAGLLLAIIFLALIFAAPRFLPSGIDGVMRSEVAQIGSGFAGTKYIGSWTLVCSPKGQDRTNTAAADASTGRCRMARYYRDKYNLLVLTIAFRYAGPGRQLTMIVRYPPVGGKGPYLTLVLATKMSLRLPVYGCNKSACIAVGALIPAAQSLLVAAPQAQVVLPSGSDGKQYTIGIRLDGLAPALDGMHRAEL